MKKSPEYYILALTLLLVAGGLIGLTLGFPNVSDITGISTSDQRGKLTQKLKEDELKAAEQGWDQPAVWSTPANHHPLFLSEGYIFYASLYPSGNYIQKDDGNARTAGGVLISWYRKYGLNFQDANIDHEDPDNDGFSNKIEYLNGKSKTDSVDGSQSTNPADPASHPPYLGRLRLDKYDHKPFHIQFLGHQVLGGADFFQIYLSDVESSLQPNLKKAGDALGFDNYIIGPYHEIIMEEMDPSTGNKHNVNRSTLELDRPDIGTKILLIYRKEIDSPESTANFVMLMPAYIGKTIDVSIGKTFELPYVPGSQYLVLNADDTGADIRDAKTNQVAHVARVADGEWDDVPQPVTPPPSPDTSASAKTQ